MLAKIQKYFINIKPVYIDGSLYVLIALFGAMEATFNNDEVYKYVNVYVIFWMKQIIIWSLAIVGALKMFRSTSYSDHVDSVAANKALTDGNSKQTVQVTETKTNETKINPTPDVTSSNPAK